MDHDIFRDIISFLGFAISLFLLIIHIKNRGTQLSTYRISRATFRSSEIVLHFIGSEQLEGNVLLKLVLFNPGSIASVIQSFAVFERVSSPNGLLRLFGFNKWQRIEDAKWWPTKDTTMTNPKLLEDVYESLYVEDHRTILVTIPGIIDRRQYLFEVCTNNGCLNLMTTIDGFQTHFAFSFKQKYDEA